MMNLSTQNKHTLLIAVNQMIEEQAAGCAQTVFLGQEAPLVYPPNGGFTTEEAKALQSLRGNEPLQAALRKLLADCAAGVVFDLLNLLDGTADPKQGQWGGVVLVDALTNDDEQREFLHDGLFDAYWDWREIRPDKTWQLDLLPE